MSSGKNPSVRQSRKISKARAQAKIENISMLGLTVRMGPVGLYVYAADFLETAKAAGAAGDPFSPARNHLVSHAIELALKAFLSLKGQSLLQLADSHGHNLAALLDEAERNGLCDLVQLSESQRAQIRAADAYYAGKVFEYPAVGEMVRGMSNRPDFDKLKRTAEAMIIALREPCLIGSEGGGVII